LRKSHIYLFIAQVIYAVSFIVAKILTRDYIPAYALVFLRVLCVAPLFWITDFIFVRERTERKDIPKLLLLAIVGVVINQTLFIKGLSLTSPISAAIMMISSPILVVIVASILIKERITLVRSVGIAVGFTGAATLMLNSGLAGGGKQDNPLGDLLILINALSWGFYLVLSKPLMAKYHTVTILKWIFTLALPIIALIGVNEFKDVAWHLFPVKIWLFTFFVVFGTTFLAYLLNVYALKDLSPSVVSAYIYLQPLLTALIAISTGNDTLSFMKIISALMIFAGVYLVSKQPKKSAVDNRQFTDGNT